MPYVNHRWLGGLLTNWRTMADRIQRLHELRASAGVPARPAAGQGAHRDARRAREARGQPRRRRRHAPPAGRDLHRRPAQGAARGARGAPARAAGDRARRHELRSRRGRLRHPRQRRRDSLVLARDPGDRRRDRGRQAEGHPRRGCAGRAAADGRPERLRASPRPRRARGGRRGRGEPEPEPQQSRAGRAEPRRRDRARRRTQDDRDLCSHGQAAPRRHERGDDGLQARAPGDRTATSTPPSSSCARRAWHPPPSAPTARPPKASS